MSVRSNALAVVREIERIAVSMDEEYRPLLQEIAESTKNDIQVEWPNPANSGPQASGRPSQSTGRSQGGWRRKVDRLSVVVWNNVDYAQWVHFARRSTSQAAEDARLTFQEDFEAVGNEIAERLTEELNSIDVNEER